MRANHLVLPVETCVVQPESFKLSQIDVDPVADEQMSTQRSPTYTMDWFYHKKPPAFDRFTR